jgi:hypothetical protein
LMQGTELYSADARQIYLGVLGAHAGMGSAGAFRVCRQFNEELVDCMLRHQVFIQVMSARIDIEHIAHLMPKLRYPRRLTYT